MIGKTSINKFNRKIFISTAIVFSISAYADEGLMAYYPFNGSTNDASGQWVPWNRT